MYLCIKLKEMVSKCSLWGLSLIVFATAHHLVSTNKVSRSDDKFNTCAHQNEHQRKRCIARLICSDLAHENWEQSKMNATECIQQLVQEGRSKSEEIFRLDPLLTDSNSEKTQNSQMDKIGDFIVCLRKLQKCKRSYVQSLSNKFRELASCMAACFASYLLFLGDGKTLNKTKRNKYSGCLARRAGSCFSSFYFSASFQNASCYRAYFVRFKIQ